MNKIPAASSILHNAIAVLVVALAFAMANADAATVRTTFVSATGVCAGPIPSSDGALRRSPAGIRNQGTSAVFVSCSVPADFVGDREGGTIEAHFHNFGGATATVYCALTAGNRESGLGSVAGSTYVTAGGNSWVNWNDLDKMDARGSNNFSCILPPDMEINLVVNQNNDSDNGL